MTSHIKPTDRWQKFLSHIPVLGQVLQRPLGMLGFAITLLFILTVIFAPLLAPYDYARQDIPNLLQGPSSQYPLGTDRLGRDLLSRLIYGSRIALVVALPSVGIALLGGIVLGVIAGYVGGIVDDIVIISMDSIKAFPAVMLALTILALLGPSLLNEILVMGLAWIPNYGRVVRAQVMAAKQNVYVEAEHALGAPGLRIIGRHILPNIIAPVLILAAMDIPAVITFEAGLSFLGLGVPPPTPSWGAILSDGFDCIRQTPWPITWASATLLVTTLGFTLFGENLRDVLDPRLAEAKEPQ